MNLTVVELQSFKNLLLISRQIYDIYYDLIDLEIEGLKDSEEYAHGLMVLFDLLYAEQNYYDSIRDNEKLVSELLEIVNKYESYTLADTLMGVKVGNDKYLIKSRILERLSDLLDNMEYEDEEGYEDEEEYEESELDEDFSDLLDLELEVQNDFLKTILKLLSLAIQNPKYADIKDWLITYKYRLAYTFTSIEEDFITSRFTIPEELHWTHTLLVKNRSIFDADLNYIKDSAVVDALNDEIDHLLGAYQINGDEEIKFNSIMANIIVRSCLLFASSIEKSKFKATLLNELINLEVTDDFGDEIVYGAVNSIDKDRSLVSQITDIRGKD